MQTAGTSNSIVIGSARVAAATNNPTPSGFSIFLFRNSGITVAEAGVSAVPSGTAFRLYAENLGVVGPDLINSIQTGVAIANTSASDVTVKLELSSLDGSFTPVTGSLQIPANGQRVGFVTQITNLIAETPYPFSFKGVLRVSSSASISVVGFRGRYNERGDFLITTLPAVNEEATPSSAPLFFPHIADSGGLTTQFILFSGRRGQFSSGAMQLYSQSGTVLNLMLQ